MTDIDNFTSDSNIRIPSTNDEIIKTTEEPNPLDAIDLRKRNILDTAFSSTLKERIVDVTINTDDLIGLQSIPDFGKIEDVCGITQFDTDVESSARTFPSLVKPNVGLGAIDVDDNFLESVQSNNSILESNSVLTNNSRIEEELSKIHEELANQNLDNNELRKECKLLQKENKKQRELNELLKKENDKLKTKLKNEKIKSKSRKETMETQIDELQLQVDSLELRMNE